MAYTHINPGEEIEVSSRIYYSPDKTRVSKLAKLPLEELSKLEAASVKKEKAIFAKFNSIVAEWEAQAAETVSLRQAQTYLKVRPVKHTSNQWKSEEYDQHILSNMVYKMSYRVSERTQYDHISKKSIVVSWNLTWCLYYNTIPYPGPDNHGPGLKIAGQDKRFTDKDVMEKYLKGRIDAYAHLFTELSPPIPKGQEGRFSVNGVLLPGYTMESEWAPHKAVDELLAFLGEDLNTFVPPVPEEQTEPTSLKPANKKPQTRSAKKRPPTR